MKKFHIELPEVQGLPEGFEENRKPTTIETMYDRPTRTWIVQVLDQYGYEMESDWIVKADLDFTIRQFEKKYGISYKPKKKPKRSTGGQHDGM